jgi:hypothetical protein
MMENTETQPCLVCGHPLETCDPAKTGFLSVNDGVIYSTSGNYGSTVLDDNGSIVFVICDACLVKHRDRLRAYSVTRPRPRPEWTQIPVGDLIPDKIPTNSSFYLSPLDTFITEVEKHN